MKCSLCKAIKPDGKE
uniref:Uncharacterized protein n=1 Tax=Caldilinea aerophila TaxID=133453 RepID=A0A7C1K135_9CHLR